jgi:hypothetical protein
MSEGIYMSNLRLCMSPITKKIYAGKIKANGIEWAGNKTDVTDDFHRCIVLRYLEQGETVFEVDGLKFKIHVTDIE